MTAGGLWLESQPLRPRIPVARIDIGANGMVSVQGQVMSVDDFALVVKKYQLDLVRVTVAREATYGTVDAVTHALAAEGGSRVRFLVDDPDLVRRR